MKCFVCGARTVKPHSREDIEDPAGKFKGEIVFCTEKCLDAFSNAPDVPDDVWEKIKKNYN